MIEKDQGIFIFNGYLNGSFMVNMGRRRIDCQASLAANGSVLTVPAELSIHFPVTDPFGRQWLRLWKGR